MQGLFEKILNHSANQKVLQFLKINLQQPPKYFKHWSTTHCAFNEGGTAFFDRFGKDVPAGCKYALHIYNVMIQPNTGAIFAFQTGRYSMFFRCDFARSGLVNSDGYRRGFTFDCIRDITELGEDWCFLENAEFEGEEDIQLKWAFEKSKNQKNNK